MRRDRHAARDLTVGVVVVLAAVIFAVGIFSIGSEQRLWSRKVTYLTRLPNTNGLQVGSPVRLVGVQVGTVTDIIFAEDPNRVDIDVVLKVDQAVQRRIRTDSSASLRSLSLLAGDKFVEITPGSPRQPELPPGSYLRVPPGMGLDELQEIGANIADDLGGVTTSLRVILDQMQDRKTLLGQALFDPEFGRETLGNLKEAVIALNQILQKIQKGEGLAGRLVTDDAYADATLDSLQGSLQRIEKALAQITDEKGALLQALGPEGSFTRTLANLQSSSESLLAVANDLKQGRGVAGRLMTDEAFADEFLGNLRKSAEALQAILDKINRGDGTAGAFVNDPNLYQDLLDVLHGVKKSKMMSWFLRHYREEGEKARIKEERKKKEETMSGEKAGEGL